MFAYCLNNPVSRGDWNGQTSQETTARIGFGLTLIVAGIALLLAAPTGGGSLAIGALVMSSSAVMATSGLLIGAGTLVAGEALADSNIMFAKQSRKSDKERATDKPSWVNKNGVDPGKSAQQNAKELLDNKYGSGNWKTGANSEFSKIVKWINRGLGIAPFLLTSNMEE